MGLLTNRHKTHRNLSEGAKICGKIRSRRTKYSFPKVVRFHFLILFLLVIPAQCLGGGVFHVLPPTLNDRTVAVARLSVLVSSTYLITVSESSVEYRIDQTFFNDNDYPLDGLFSTADRMRRPLNKTGRTHRWCTVPFYSVYAEEHFLPTLRDLTVPMKDPSLLGIAGDSVMVIQPIHIGVRQQKSFRTDQQP